MEKTHEKHYELYRREHMEQKGFKDGEDSIHEAYQHKREEYMASLQKKEEMIRQTFVQKVTVVCVTACWSWAGFVSKIFFIKQQRRHDNL